MAIGRIHHRPRQHADLGRGGERKENQREPENQEAVHGQRESICRATGKPNDRPAVSHFRARPSGAAPDENRKLPEPLGKSPEPFRQPPEPFYQPPEPVRQPTEPFYQPTEPFRKAPQVIYQLPGPLGKVPGPRRKVPELSGKPNEPVYQPNGQLVVLRGVSCEVAKVMCDLPKSVF
jgi:hypothetical protein